MAAAPTAKSKPLLLVTGLKREARIGAGEGIVTVCSAGDPALLRSRLSELPAQDFSGVISFGIAGGLSPSLRTGDVVIASGVVSENVHHPVDEAWALSLASHIAPHMPLERGLIAGVEAVLLHASHKTEAHRKTRAIAVDMESHIAAAYAKEHGLPFVAIRAISDPASRGLPRIAADALKPDGSVDMLKVLTGICRDPSQIPALIAAGRDSKRAFEALRRVRGLPGFFFGLGLPDFR